MKIKIEVPEENQKLPTAYACMVLASFLMTVFALFLIVGCLDAKI